MEFMTLGSLIIRNLRMVVRCRAARCGVETSLEPIMFARGKTGLDQSLDKVRQRICCAACGSHDIELAPQRRDGSRLLDNKVELLLCAK
jgi:hypothetical protein